MDNRNKIQHINKLFLLIFLLLCFYRYPQKYPHMIFRPCNLVVIYPFPLVADIIPYLLLYDTYHPQ